MEAIRIKPEWCRTLVHADPAAHIDAVDAVALLDRALNARLLSRLLRTRSSHEALGVMADTVRRRHGARTTAQQGLASAALETLRARSGAPLLREVAEDLGVSARHLRRVVADHAGTSPRRFARVLRFLRLLREADAAPAPGWAQLAAAHGYADQAHLIREARGLTGTTPAVLHAERQAEIA